MRSVMPARNWRCRRRELFHGNQDFPGQPLTIMGVILLLFYCGPATGLYRIAMYFFFHLLTGTIIGLLLGDLLKDRRWVLPCAFGSVLPDLVDKPLGLVILPASIGNGRIFGHAALAVLVLGIVGLLVLIYWKNPAIVGIAAGILSHQVLDTMWQEPKNWFYPVYGAVPRLTHSSDLIALLLSDITNPLEVLLFIFLCAGIGVFIFHRRIAAFLARHLHGVRSLLACGVFGLCILSGVCFGLSRGKNTISLLAWNHPTDFIIGGIVAAMAALLCWRWYHRKPDMNPV